MVIRSSERLFASSIAILAVFDQLPAIALKGFSAPTYAPMRVDSFSRFAAVSLICGSPSITMLRADYKNPALTRQFTRSLVRQSGNHRTRYNFYPRQISEQLSRNHPLRQSP